MHDHLRASRRGTAVALAAFAALAVTTSCADRLNGFGPRDPFDGEALWTQREYELQAGAWPVAMDSLAAATAEAEELPGEGFVALGILPVAWVDGTGVAPDFVGDGFGRELVWVSGGQFSIAFAKLPLHDPGSGTTGAEARIDFGYVRCLGEGGRRGRQRCAPSWDQGLSLLWLDLAGADRDTVGAGWFGRAGLLVRLWGNWEAGLHGGLHAWLGIDEHAFRLMGEASVGFRLAYGL